jgi:uncharacterized coiled-coil protein SlyX
MALDQATVDSAGLGQQFDRRIFDLEGKSAGQTGDVADLQQQESDLSASRAQRARDAAAELKPSADKLKEAAHKAADEPIQKEERMEPFQRPALDPQELQKTFGMLLVASMFAGKASRSPYNNTMTALTGAMNGFMKEDDRQVAESLKIYDTNLASMKERNAALQRDMAANDRKNKNNVAAWTLEHDLILERYDFDDKAAGHEQKSLSDKVKRGESIVQSTEKALDRAITVRAQLGDRQQAREDKKEEAAKARAQADSHFREMMDFRKDQADKKTGPIMSESELASGGAQVAAGMPINQVLPGYGMDVSHKREQLRVAAISQIKSQTGMTDQQAGEELANRKIGYVAGQRSVTQLTAMLGATRQAVDQLDFNIKKTKEEMKKLGSTDLSPLLNAIARGEEKWTGNPAYSSLFYYLSATGQESARILSGGQASIAQLHQGAQEEARKWANINMTPASFDAVGEAMHDEGKERIKTFERAIDKQRIGSARPSVPADGAPASPTMPTATGPDGKKIQFKDGKWQPMTP